MPGRTCKYLFCLLLLAVMGATPLFSKDKVTVAVLPFSVHSAENIDYVQQGIMDMLSSRIAANDKITVIGKEKVVQAMKTVKSKELSPVDIQSLGKALDVDYAVAGSITKIGQGVSIDGKLVDIAQSKTPVVIFTQSPGMDDVISKINDFAQRINQFVLGTAPGAGAPQTGSAAVTALAPIASSTPAGKEAQIISGIKSGRKGTLTGSINPDFVSATTPLDKKGFWMSQKYPTEFRGMDIGDVNGDGLNEIVVIDLNNVYIFQKKDREMQLLQKISGKGHEKYIGVDIVSLTGNKAREIIVSNIFSTRQGALISHTVQSFVLSWSNGEFKRIANDLPWFFRVIGNGQDARLLGQKLSVAASSSTGTSLPFQTAIHEMVWREGRFEEGKRMKIPSGLCIYGLTIDNLGEGKDKIIGLDSYDHLYVLEESDKDLSKIETVFGGKEMLFKSDDVYGGSNININMYGSGEGGEASPYNLYFNPRILTFDNKADGKRQILIAKNDAPGGRILQNLKVFTNSEFYNFQWDSLGLAENWHTKKMRGYAADYQIKDIDNDGENDIVIALVTSAGSLVGRNSVIVSYKLHMQ